MKANKKVFMKNDTQAQVGIGTLIIFIAMVLVAAVAAAVLIQTSGTLQQKAQATGEEAIQEVSSNIMIKSVEGNRTSSTASEIDSLFLQAALSAGGDDVDLGELIITVTDGTNSTTLTSSNFNMTDVRDKDNSFNATASTYVMNDNDLIEITLAQSDALSTITLEPRTEVKVVLIPEAGTPVNVEFTTPATYAMDTRIALFP